MKNKMYNFLDRSIYQKVRVLLFLYNSRNNCSITEISEYVNISEKTVIKFLEELSKDFVEINIGAEIEYKNNKSVQLNTKDNFSIKKMERFYLVQSLTYKACDEIFYNTFDNIGTFAEKNYTSYATMYRRINKIKPLLDQFNLKYSTQDMSSFHGTETQFRYFYFLFYWNSCWGEVWPFTFVTREQMLEILSKENKTITEPMLYWLAITITRAKLGYIIENDVSYKSFTKHNYLYQSFF
ncbi:helix-turn-helix domain-containing protein [Cytobacillus sp. Sa5YUA1]|uniref:Helix-turn-helix domain-containing protein n=1 Tax=Cytobacillus stercorigallinarum TaxID=2762240 RepID=A0ABR8QLN3_9BACI|nr:helix-turn-helix domain-containing protein [Cytobacillus stercorigallinarum]MBD7936433.1 helix-turn-helix domain-containing protein [Cytobacillus stercorigallinarum]